MAAGRFWTAGNKDDNMSRNTIVVLVVVLIIVLGGYGFTR
ncbi:hypothetical protein Z945_2387 [Sulfitobacter noctilucae]|nr:hypothetical protein Z945_2387 [Sulfitobacter noctilucae]